jgi:hypothetical protein
LRAPAHAIWLRIAKRRVYGSKKYPWIQVNRRNVLNLSSTRRYKVVAWDAVHCRRRPAIPPLMPQSGRPRLAKMQVRSTMSAMQTETNKSIPDTGLTSIIAALPSRESLLEKALTIIALGSGLVLTIAWGGLLVWLAGKLMSLW